MSLDSRKPYRLGRRPGQQGPRPLPSNQGRVEKLATGQQGRTSEERKNIEKLKPVNNILTVGTWNVQTLWATGKLELLRHEMTRFRYDIIGISEVRWTGKDETANGDFICSGEDNAHVRGVRLLLGMNARKALIGYNPVNSRIITARFNAAPFKIIILHAYAPTSACSDEDIEAFYNILEDTLDKIHKKDVFIITGDWNAKVGSQNTDDKSVMEKYGYGDGNERGECLLEFATAHRNYLLNVETITKVNFQAYNDAADLLSHFKIKNGLDTKKITNIKVVNNCMKGSLIKIISIQDYSDLNEEDESSDSKNELDEMLGSESDIDSEDQQYEASNIFSDGICDDLDGIKFSDMRVFDKVRPELEKSYFELKINRKKKCINKQIACSILTENKPVLSNDRLACVIQK
ncbi:unnamed protein product [Rotaria magnacalcarata]|uniref:Endonuclease/exonuclease/phosphatase domain-containing protein n=3 Tax=Rotaria magnacalcarata TaxID=392030 RepID=A0A816TFV1_9BILA|nr:unnamed protein product [Rotaria magnacalcarata]